MRQIGLYFPRYLIGAILTVCFVVVIKYLGKYLTICLILSYAKEAIYKRQNSIFTFYINTFQRKLFTKIGIDSGFACEWLVGVYKVVHTWPLVKANIISKKYRTANCYARFPCWMRNSMFTNIYYNNSLSETTFNAMLSDATQRNIWSDI